MGFEQKPGDLTLNLKQVGFVYSRITSTLSSNQCITRYLALPVRTTTNFGVQIRIVRSSSGLNSKNYKAQLEPK